MGFFLVVATWGHSSLPCVGFSLQWLLLLPSMGSKAHRRQYLWRTGLVALQHVGSSWTRDRTCDSCIGRWILYHWATRAAPLPVFLIIAILVGVQWYLIVVLILISWMANVLEHLLTCLFAICVCSLEKCLLRSFEAYVILYPFCLRRKKFERTTVAFHFFFYIITHFVIPADIPSTPHSGICSDATYSRGFSWWSCLKKQSPPISLSSFILFSESTCHSLI